MRSRSNLRNASDAGLREFGRASIGALVFSAACGGGAASDASAPVLLKEDTEVIGSANATLADLGLECTLWPSESSGRHVTMRIENHGDVSVELLTRGTLWDRLSPVLNVRRDATDLAYTGIMAERGNPLASEFIGVLPGEAISVDYDVAYNYQLLTAARLELALASPVLGIRVSNGLLSVQHDCGRLIATMDPGAKPLLGSAEQPLIWVDEPCTPEQEASVDSAEVIARGATAIGAALVGANGLYEQWFGTPTTANLAIVNEVFASIQSNWDVFTGECDTGIDPCFIDVSAWVTRSQDPDLVHLCPLFFEHSSLSVEASSKVGTLVHEKSHLNPGTFIDDEEHVSDCASTCNSVEEARELAANDRPEAVTNGENYEHFIANAYLVGALISPIGLSLQ